MWAASPGGRPCYFELFDIEDFRDRRSNPVRVAAGATLERAASDAFYGERSGVVIDPFGHRWNIGHSIEEVTPEEMQRRYVALFPEG